jgi:predicted transport protein
MGGTLGPRLLASSGLVALPSQAVLCMACAEIYPQAKVITLYLRVDPTTVELEEGFSREVTKLGHFGTGNLELSLKTMENFANLCCGEHTRA